MTRKPDPLVVFTLGVLIASGPLSIDMYLPSLPVIQEELATDAATVQLTLAAYMAGLGIGQLGWGPVADRFGRRGPLTAGVLLYVVASAACALATSVEALIVLRFLQAIGGAAGAVITRAIVRDLATGAEAARLLSTLTLIMGVAPILAPLMGGVVLDAWGWRPIFGVLSVFGAASAVLLRATLPETAPAAAPGRVTDDARSVLADPLFRRATLAAGLNQAGMFAYITGAPFLYITQLGLSARGFALAFGLNAAGLIAGAQANRWFVGQYGPVGTLLRASTASVVGGLLVLAAAFSSAGLWVIGPAIFAWIVTLGVVMPNTAVLAMERHGARAGVASALLGAAQYAISAVAAVTVSLANDGTVRPSAAVLAATALGTWALARGVRAAWQGEA